MKTSMATLWGAASHHKRDEGHAIINCYFTRNITAAKTSLTIPLSKLPFFLHSILSPTCLHLFIFKKLLKKIKGTYYTFSVLYMVLILWMFILNLAKMLNNEVSVCTINNLSQKFRLQTSLFLHGETERGYPNMVVSSDLLFGRTGLMRKAG